MMKENTLMYKGYIAHVSFSPDDEVFHGKISGITDLVTFESDSAKLLKPAFIEAVDDYIDTCTELGKVPDKTYLQ
ncbi:type II toxin-antitoxin system HicB family antitoxin [Pedobacter sp.]|uniref:type II toxin-antitoxin system HicB family antitoxin n=1 Tax=Pedobacter sp. TaxID=1411316 RepID=UPI003D7F74B9